MPKYELYLRIEPEVPYGHKHTRCFTIQEITANNLEEAASLMGVNVLSQLGLHESKYRPLSVEPIPECREKILAKIKEIISDKILISEKDLIDFLLIRQRPEE